MGGCFKLTYEVLNQTAMNRTLWSQTKACITKFSCVKQRQNRASLEALVWCDCAIYCCDLFNFFYKHTILTSERHLESWKEPKVARSNFQKNMLIVSKVGVWFLTNICCTVREM
jgi:hypothetical protein